MRALILSFLMLCFVWPIMGQRQISNEVKVLLEKRGELYFSFITPTNISLAKLSSIISIDAYRFNNRVFAYANEKEFNRFLSYGINYQLESESYLKIAPQMATSVSAFMQDWDAYPTYYQYDSVMQKLAADYPNLCKYHVLDSLSSGRIITILQLGNSVNIAQKKPSFLYTSSMHGNELAGYVIMLRLADYLLSNYGSNAIVDSIMNSIDIWINPLANPDGAYRYGDSTLAGAARYNANFVDLNRNYPDPEDGPHPDGEVWQDESKLFMQLADSIHFTMSANFHGGAEVVNYPWDTWSKLSADDDWWKFISHEYADTVQFYSPSNFFLGPSAAGGTGVVNGYQWYTTAGSRQDYMNYFQACREVTIELSYDKLPAASKLNNLWNYHYRSLLKFIDRARYGLQGVVCDSLTGSPLEAMVYINGHDVDSSQVFSHLPFGDYYRLLDSAYYSISFSAPHYYTKTIDSVHIIKGKALNINISLVPDYTDIKQNKLQMFRVFPNPAHERLNVVSATVITKVDLYSMQGKLIRAYKTDFRKSMELDLVGVKPGIYLLMINRANENRSVQKIIIR